VELRALVSQTREAIESGRYGAAVAACEHMLATFPASLGAHRMLGEALVEQGAFDDAHQHFTHVLSVDPLDTVAHLGLGVIAEERGDPDGAYTHYLNSWEIHPELDHLRDELVRLRAALDVDATLHPTRPVLATFYARGGHIRRALAEWRSVIADEPENMAARLALAQMLWLSGDDSGAMTASREVLEQLPDCARAMAIIADIERREHGEAAAERIDHYRSLDPSGEIALELGSVASDRDVGFLVEDTVEVPDFKAADDLVGADASVSTEEGGKPVSGTNAAEADPWAGLMREISQDTDTSGATTAVPFSWEDIGPGVADGDSDPLAAEIEAARPAGVERNAQSGGEDLGLLSDIDLVDPSIQPFSFEDESGSNAPGVPSSEGDDWFTSDDAVVPPEAPDEAVKPAAAEQGATAGGSFDLTAGWDDLDRVLHEAVPSDVSLQGYEGLIESFQAEGIRPLDPSVLGAGDEWKPLSAEEWEVDDESPEAVSPGLSTEGNESAATDTELDEFAVLDRLAQDSSFEQDFSGSSEAEGDDLGLSEADLALGATWGGIDNALDAAQPEFAGGYTAILRSLDSEQPSFDDAVQDGGPEENDSEPPLADDVRVPEEAAAGQTDLMTPPGDMDSSAFSDLKADLFESLSSSTISEHIPHSDAPPDERAYAARKRELEEAIEPEAASQGLADRADTPDRKEAAGVDRETSPWPQFAAGTVRLGDATNAGFQLFAQMREEKASLVELGILTVDRSLAWGQPETASDATQGDETVVTGPSEGDVDTLSLDRERVRALRSRLDGDVPGIEETARELEQMAASGYGAMVSRLLGEAYLRLERPAEAAEVFRRAIAERGHFR
jgi:tetratricopeptide (TPR) repeat protein